MAVILRVFRFGNRQKALPSVSSPGRAYLRPRCGAPGLVHGAGRGGRRPHGPAVWTELDVSSRFEGPALRPRPRCSETESLGPSLPPRASWAKPAACSWHWAVLSCSCLWVRPGIGVPRSPLHSKPSCGLPSAASLPPALPARLPAASVPILPHPINLVGCVVLCWVPWGLGRYVGCRHCLSAPHASRARHWRVRVDANEGSSLCWGPCPHVGVWGSCPTRSSKPLRGRWGNRGSERQSHRTAELGFTWVCCEWGPDGS